MFRLRQLVAFYRTLMRGGEPVSASRRVVRRALACASSVGFEWAIEPCSASTEGIRRVCAVWMRAIRATALVGAMGACAAASGPVVVGPPPGAKAKADGHRVIPWIEVNNSRPATIAKAAEGLHIWAGVTDTAIVSTVPGNARLYDEPALNIPGLRIIPGLKTHALLDRFDSVEGWGKVSAEVQLILDRTGAKSVLLENETAIRSYRRGETDLNPERFREAIQQLPKDVLWIWYPSIHGHSEKVQKRFEAVCKIVASTLDVQFTERGLDAPQSVKDPWSTTARRRLRACSDHATLPILYFYGDDRWWRDEDIKVARAHWPGGDVIVYPGAKRWCVAARRIVAAMKAASATEGR